MSYSLELSLPYWFLYPKDYPDQVVGYGRGDVSMEEDAEIMYCFYQNVIIEGSYYRYNDNDKGGRISDYYWNYSPACLKGIKDKLLPVSSFVSNILTHSQIGLFTSFSFDLRDSKPWVNIEDLENPEWIEKDFWIEDGYYYSVGMYTSRGEKNDAWKTAEERAFFNLVTSVAVQIGAIAIFTKIEDEDGKYFEDYEEIIGYKLNTKIKDGQVLERWLDLENELYYVLVRVGINQIMSPHLFNNKSKE